MPRRRPTSYNHSLKFLTKKASRNEVVEGFEFIKSRCIPKRKILLKSNKLSTDAAKSVKKHTNRGGRYASYTLSSHDVKTYMAASSLSHLMDGWSYLANALSSLMNGSEDISIHLAYYSELRAVMSLLGSEGIGVFDKKHLILNDANKFTYYPSRGRQKIGTHEFAWDALEEWSKNANESAYNLLKIFKVNGYDFSELTESFSPSATTTLSSSIAKDWLTKWALDVKRLKEDRTLRNNSSYRPRLMSDFTKTFSIKDTISNLFNFFQLISPLGRDSFYGLDRLLLGNLYRELFSILDTNRLLIPGTTLEDSIESAFGFVGATLDPSLKQQLLTSSSHPLFTESIKKEAAFMPVAARAIFLLRVSTGAVSLLLSDANITKDELSFVWDKYGFDHGLWSETNPIEDFYSLWNEVLNDYSIVSEETENYANDPYSLRKEFDAEISRITQFNRAMLWGI